MNHTTSYSHEYVIDLLFCLLVYWFENITKILKISLILDRQEQKIFAPTAQEFDGLDS